MPTTSACPDAQLLKQFLHGEMSDAQTAPLQEHLLECDQCAAALNQLVEQDALVKPLQGQAAATQETACEAVESLMRRLSEQPPPGLAVATQTPDMGETPTNTRSDHSRTWG